MNHAARDLLRRLATGDDQSVRAVLVPTPEFGRSPSELARARRHGVPGLDRRTRVLVRLAALLALDAPVESLRWAVELATAAGASDDVLAAVLVTTAAETGTAGLATSAWRLGLALGFDIQPDVANR